MDELSQHDVVTIKETGVIGVISKIISARSKLYLVATTASKEKLKYHIDELTLRDRSVSIGDLVKMPSRSNILKGTITKIDYLVSLKSNLDGSIHTNVSGSELIHYHKIRPHSWFRYKNFLGYILASLTLNVVGEPGQFEIPVHLPLDLDELQIVDMPDSQNSYFYYSALRPGTVRNDPRVYVIQDNAISAFELYWIEGIGAEEFPYRNVFNKNELKELEFSDFPCLDFVFNDIVHRSNRNDGECSFHIIDIKTIVTVHWQNNTFSRNIFSNELINVHFAEDFDYFPNDFVARLENNQEIGIVTAVDNAANTLVVRWLLENGQRVSNPSLQEVSIYSISHCDSYSFRPGYPIQLPIYPHFAMLRDIDSITGMLHTYPVCINIETQELSFHFTECLSIDYDDSSSDDDDEENSSYADSDYESDNSWETMSESEAEIEELLPSFQSLNIQLFIKHGLYSFESSAPDYHYFYAQSSSSSTQFLRHISKEIELLNQNLPSGIYLKHYQDRLDLMSALIIGPSETPYEGCSYLFDIYLPINYPNEPPKLFYCSYINAKLNPNLYENGRVCLSLIGTWNGDKNESWRPGHSNLLQLFISLQALVLNSSPYFNEAGYESMRHDATAIQNSILYNENAIILSLKSLCNIFKNPPSIFIQELKDIYFTTGMLEKLVAARSNFVGFSKGYSISMVPILNELTSIINITKK